MSKQSDKIIQKTKRIDEKFFQLSPKEQYKLVAEMLKDLSPNDEVRNRKQ